MASVVDARFNQFCIGYEMDDWVLCDIAKGVRMYQLVGGPPSKYYFSQESLAQFGNTRVSMNGGLQVMANEEHGRRGLVAEFLVVKPFTTATAFCLANSGSRMTEKGNWYISIGGGGALQFFLNEAERDTYLSHTFTAPIGQFCLVPSGN